jgi:hypothetical protein
MEVGERLSRPNVEFDTTVFMGRLFVRVFASPTYKHFARVLDRFPLACRDGVRKCGEGEWDIDRRAAGAARRKSVSARNSDAGAARRS